MLRRREFLMGGGAVAGLASAMRSASAQEGHWRDEAAEHVTFEFDEEWLKTYRPLLVTRGVSPTDIIGLFGMKASSPEWDVDVAIYSMSYSTQDGALTPPLGFDEHYGDHEWFYCYVDGAGELVEIAYAAYHWIVGRAEGEEIPIYEGTHPKARVDERWHNYYLTEEEGSFQNLDNFNDSLQSWLENGMGDHLALEAVTNPLTMRSRESWWKDGLDRMYAKILYSIGASGADLVDPVIGS